MTVISDPAPPACYSYPAGLVPLRQISACNFLLMRPMQLAMLKSPFKAEGLNLYSLFQKISHVSRLKSFSRHWPRFATPSGHILYHRVCDHFAFVFRCVVGLFQGDYLPLPDHYSRELRELAYTMISTDASHRPDIHTVRSYCHGSMTLIRPFNLHAALANTLKAKVH